MLATGAIAKTQSLTHLLPQYHRSLTWLDNSRDNVVIERSGAVAPPLAPQRKRAGWRSEPTGSYHFPTKGVLSAASARANITPAQFSLRYLS